MKNNSLRRNLDVFVKNDVNGNPLFVGDKVRVTRERVHFTEETEYEVNRVVNVPAKTWEGEIALLFSRGIMIRLPKEGNHITYIKPNLGNTGLVKWTWEKL